MRNPALVKIKNAFKFIAELSRSANTFPYRVVNVEQDNKQIYHVTVQVVGKNATFKMRPEDILAVDRMTDQFSPRDVRTMTYLGYLGINSPKYKILAKRLSEGNDKLVFAVHKKGSDEVAVKTASEISTDEEILKNLDQHDAHMVGYTTATEQTLAEEKQKLALLAKHKSLQKKPPQQKVKQSKK